MSGAGRNSLKILFILLTTTCALLFAACNVQVKIDSISPTSAKPGDKITITGEGFAPNTSGFSVTIGGANANVVSATDKMIVAEIPANADSGKVTVYSNNQHADSTIALTSARPAPTETPTGGETTGATGTASSPDLEALGKTPVSGIKLNLKQSGAWSVDNLFPAKTEYQPLNSLLTASDFQGAFHGVFDSAHYSYLDLNIVQVGTPEAAAKLETSWAKLLEKVTSGTVKPKDFSCTLDDGTKCQGFTLDGGTLDSNTWIFAAKDDIVWEMRLVGDAKWSDGSKAEPLLSPFTSAQQ
jgi:hypothetical protein